MKTQIKKSKNLPQTMLKPNPHQHNMLIYNDLNLACGMNFNEAIPITDALYIVKDEKNLNSGIAGCKDILQKFIIDLSTKKHSELPKVKRLVNSGSSAILFETEYGDILKLTRGNHFPLNRPAKNFDVPIFQKGKAGKTYFYVEEKLLQHGLSDGFVKIIKEKIRKTGLKTGDLYCCDTHQIGMSPKSGKLYLLDPECAKYKTIFHALFDKTLNIIKKSK